MKQSVAEKQLKGVLNLVLTCNRARTVDAMARAVESQLPALVPCDECRWEPCPRDSSDAPPPAYPLRWRAGHPRTVMGRISIDLVPGEECPVSIVLLRSGRDFDHRDRDLADLLRPHLAQALESLQTRIRMERPREWLSASGLSGRECEVMLLLATGATNRQIGTKLGLSPRTVQRHVAGIFKKLGVTTRTAAAAALNGNGSFRLRSGHW
jgi:DNA-binding CsgD family transcriptional regulator